MKKILCLLTIVTIGSSLPMVIANQTGTVFSPKRLDNLAATINIGRIPCNDEATIRSYLRNAQHSIFSEPEFLANFVFDRITWNQAIGHLSQSVYLRSGTPNESVIHRINNFTISFTSTGFTLATLIPNHDLGALENNYRYTILQRLQERNSEIIDSDLYLEVLEVHRNRAIIHQTNASYHQIEQPEIEVNFTTNNYTLNSLIQNRNLGTLNDNNEATVRAAVLAQNQNLQESDIEMIRVIDNNSAVIYGSLPAISGSIVNLQTNRWELSNNMWRPANANEERVSYEQIFCNSVMVHFTTSNENLIYMTIKPAADDKMTTGEPQHNHIYETLKPKTTVAKELRSDTTKPPLIPNEKSFLGKGKEVEKITGQDFQHLVTSYNKASKAEKMEHLNKLKENYDSLSEVEQKNLNTKARNLGIAATQLGLSGTGLIAVSKMTGVSPIAGLKTAANYLRNTISLSESSTLAAESSEAVELTPLLATSASEGVIAGQAVAAETTIVASEGAVLATDATVSIGLAPETLGLSLIVGGIIAAGFGLFYWLSSSHLEQPAVRHNAENKYDEIEKYYKFLAHDQLKLDLSPAEWIKIKQIYKEYSNNYEKFKWKVKLKIINFYREDHSGWGGSITDDDINILIKIVFTNMQNINQHFSSNSNHGWKIVTNTIGSYFKIEEE